MCIRDRLYYVTLMCTVVCIQAGTGRGGGSIDHLQSSSLCLVVCVYLICASDNDHCCVVRRGAITLSPLPFPSLSSCRPTISPFTQQVSGYTRVRLVLWPPNFQESDHALSNYWYRYRSNSKVSVSEVSVNYGIGLTLTDRHTTVTYAALP